MMPAPTMQDAYNEACRQLGEAHVAAALAAQAYATEVERLTADPAPDPAT